MTTAAGVSYLAQQSLENISVFGLDPFIVLGISVVGSGGVGWLLGPFLGNAVFGLRYRRLGGEIAEVSVSASEFGRIHRKETVANERSCNRKREICSGG